MNKKQKKVFKIVVISLSVIGIITIYDNGRRFVNEFKRVVKNHQWSLEVIK